MHLSIGCAAEKQQRQLLPPPNERHLIETFDTPHTKNIIIILLSCTLYAGCIAIDMTISNAQRTISILFDSITRLQPQFNA